MKVLVVFDDSERIDHTDSKSQQDIVFTERDVERVLNEQGHTVQALAVRENLWEALTPYNPREWLIFNLCEQIRAKTYLEPYATSIYEHLGFSYTGSNRHTLAACLNKPRTKEILQAHDIPTAAFQVLSPNALTRRLDFPLFVKPIAED
ncbi:MAG: hypothetical protein HY257_00340, partial [Chloroflexi bacterium]|nr:hypothetical protein [Chloroflexota bacterium]